METAESVITLGPISKRDAAASVITTQRPLSTPDVDVLSMTALDKELEDLGASSAPSNHSQSLSLTTASMPTKFSERLDRLLRAIEVNIDADFMQGIREAQRTGRKGHSASRMTKEETRSLLKGLMEDASKAEQEGMVPSCPETLHPYAKTLLLGLGLCRARASELGSKATQETVRAKTDYLSQKSDTARIMQQTTTAKLDSIQDMKRAFHGSVVKKTTPEWHDLESRIDRAEEVWHAALRKYIRLLE